MGRFHTLHVVSILPFGRALLHKVGTRTGTECLLTSYRIDHIESDTVLRHILSATSIVYRVVQETSFSFP